MKRSNVSLRHGLILTWVSVVCGTALAPMAQAAGRSPFVPVSMSASFSDQSMSQHWSCPIKLHNGPIIYTLSLEPDLDVHGSPVVVELALRRSNGLNLLVPAGRWHGSQPYIFAALDLANGPKSSAYDGTRTIIVKRLGLVLRITIRDSKVSQFTDGTIQIEALNLEIKADNLNP